MKKYFMLIMLTALLISLPACSPKEGSENNGVGYPAPETAAIEDAYLAPVLSGGPAVVSGSLSIPAPAAGKAVIHGKMQTADGKAFTGTLFIGIFGLYIREGYPPPVEALVADSPAVVVDSEGQFYFADVQPGVYGFKRRHLRPGRVLSGRPTGGGRLSVGHGSCIVRKTGQCVCLDPAAGTPCRIQPGHGLLHVQQCGPGCRLCSGSFQHPSDSDRGLGCASRQWDPAPF